MNCNRMIRSSSYNASLIPSTHSLNLIHMVTTTRTYPHSKTCRDHPPSFTCGCGWITRLNRRTIQRLRRIICAIDSNDIHGLRDLATTPPGLVCTPVRRRVWPLLVSNSMTHIDIPKLYQPLLSYWNESIDDVMRARHPSSYRDCDQVNRDVDRAFHYSFSAHTSTMHHHHHHHHQPHHSSYADYYFYEQLLDYFGCEEIVDRENIKYYRNCLSRVLAAVFSSSPSLYYYQGYHDIVSLLILTVGESHAYHISKHLSNSDYLKAFHSSTLKDAMSLLSLVPILIEHQDDTLYRHLFVKSSMDPHFSIAWLLTWFTHVISDISILSFLFDIFLTSHPYPPLYCIATIVLWDDLPMPHRSNVLEIAPEYSNIYVYYQSLSHGIDGLGNPNVINWNAIIKSSFILMEKIPPNCLINNTKTSHGNNKNQNNRITSTIHRFNVLLLLRDLSIPALVGATVAWVWYAVVAQTMFSQVYNT